MHPALRRLVFRLLPKARGQSKDQIMKLFNFVPALAGLSILFASPVLAHDGVVHDGCAADQVFRSGDLLISGAFTRAMLPSAKVGGGYLVIENRGTAPDRLVGGASEAAAVVQVHKMEMEGDMMKMGEVEGGLEIPAGGSVTLTPGGFHLMLMGITQPFQEGECVEMMLKFETAGDVPVVLSVGGTAADAAPDPHAGHEMAPAAQ